MAARRASTAPARSQVAARKLKGGYYAEWEQPELFAQELRAGFRPLREGIWNERGALLPPRLSPEIGPDPMRT